MRAIQFYLESERENNPVLPREQGNAILYYLESKGEQSSTT